MENGKNMRRWNRWQICHRCRWYRGQFCCRFHWHRWSTLTCEYLRKFLKKFEMVHMEYSGAGGELIHGKTRSKKSCDTVPLKILDQLERRHWKDKPYFWSCNCLFTEPGQDVSSDRLGLSVTITPCTAMATATTSPSTRILMAQLSEDTCILCLFIPQESESISLFSTKYSFVVRVSVRWNWWITFPKVHVYNPVGLQES